MTLKVNNDYITVCTAACPDLGTYEALCEAKMPYAARHV
jgi:hypothetical protein